MVEGWLGERVAAFEPGGGHVPSDAANNLLSTQTPSGVSDSVPPALLEAVGTGPGSENMICVQRREMGEARRPCRLTGWCTDQQ